MFSYLACLYLKLILRLFLKVVLMVWCSRIKCLGGVLNFVFEFSAFDAFFPVNN